MNDHEQADACPLHGKPTKRSSCRECNAAYMRVYLRRRRLEIPARPLWERARTRARRYGLHFSISKADVQVPELCPALGIPITLGDGRSDHSPSLDRVVPALGYVPGNVCVISDRANRLKADCDLPVLRHRSLSESFSRRDEYRKIVRYVERQLLLREIRERAEEGGRAGAEWLKIAAALERLFERETPVDTD